MPDGTYRYFHVHTGEIIDAVDLHNQQRGVTMSNRLAAAQERVRLAEEALAKAMARPQEPIREGVTIITFDKTFGNVGGTEYSYAAIRVEANGKWYTTIKSTRTGYNSERLTWDQLLDFIELGEDSMPEIWVATTYELVL